ncbi:SDR family oxidoreductase [Pontivivens nitratireducens]|uniref:SDR family oxidoreductase n=1 Tax=Pontivivens nitratireducens TaxID=2758038 RepID=UPI00163AFC1E|nr:SDR family oxidoreductase [Pontibrevibacter nitratireducens]
MDFGIAGKWALVCGASKGLGLGCARALAEEGVNLVIVARTERLLREAADSLRALPGANEVIAVAADITTPEGRAAAMSAPNGPGDAFDILLNNAGGPPPGDFHDWDDSDWQAALNANMLTPIALIRALVDGMAERGFGRIVNVTSVSVKAPIANLGLSNGARSGLTGFVAGIARGPLARQGVTINNLLPGAFATDRLIGTIEDEALSKGMAADSVLEARRQSIPTGRLGTPEEFGAAFAFLCSRQAAYINGQNILCDGGAYPGTH